MMAELNKFRSTSERTNGETINWYKNTVNNGKDTEENIKKETIKYFGSQVTDINKQTIKRRLLDFNKEYKMKKTIAQKKSKKITLISEMTMNIVFGYMK